VSRRPVLRDRLVLGDAVLTREAARSLRVFVELAWPILEPQTRLLPNWHIDLICEYLEAVTAGALTRLVINLPPRYMKSLLVSVLWPTWEWIQAPYQRWLFASYSESLATKHSLDRRTVLQSRWYRDRWGTRVRLVATPNEKTEYQNDRRGVMVALSMGGSATGKGGNRIVMDDPHHPSQAESDTQREQAITFFTQTLSTRLDDKRQGAIVLVMQRLHHRDLSAVCLDQGYTHLCLPAESEQRTTIVFPRSGRTLTREPGDVLWAAREDVADLAAQQHTLGAYAYAGQYQQRPSPRGGGRFKREWWRFYDELPPVDRWAQSWDLTFKGESTSDYVVGLVAAQRGADIYLVDRYKARASFQQTCAAIRALAARYPQTGAVYIEEAANGAAVIDALRREVPGLIAVRPEGGKLSRAAACEPRVEAGNISLPRPTDANGRPRPDRAWVDDFLEQLAAFPKGDHDDDVDAFSQLLVQWQLSMLSAEDLDRIWAINNSPHNRIHSDFGEPAMDMWRDEDGNPRF
jgi:predicted phage terminase large subunit-like protein